MRRSLASLSFLALALAVLAFGAVYAPFTAEDSDSGTITAANLSITVKGTTTSLDFELPSFIDCDAIFPGDVCKDVVLVTNNSDVEVTLATPTAMESGALEDCDGGDQLSTTFNLGYNPDVQVISGGGGIATFDIITTFSAGAGDECQGETGTVEVTVVATATS